MTHLYRQLHIYQCRPTARYLLSDEIRKRVTPLLSP
jgi:hypothetical protein